LLHETLRNQAREQRQAVKSEAAGEG